MILLYTDIETLLHYNQYNRWWVWRMAAYRRTHGPGRLAWSEGWQPTGASYSPQINRVTLEITTINIVLSIIISIIIIKQPCTTLLAITVRVCSISVEYCCFKPLCRVAGRLWCVCLRVSVNRVVANRNRWLVNLHAETYCLAVIVNVKPRHHRVGHGLHSSIDWIGSSFAKNCLDWIGSDDFIYNYHNIVYVKKSCLKQHI